MIIKTMNNRYVNLNQISNFWVEEGDQLKWWLAPNDLRSAPVSKKTIREIEEHIRLANNAEYVRLQKSADFKTRIEAISAAMDLVEQHLKEVIGVDPAGQAFFRSQLISEFDAIENVDIDTNPFEEADVAEALGDILFSISALKGLLTTGDLGEI